MDSRVRSISTVFSKVTFLLSRARPQDRRFRPLQHRTSRSSHASKATMRQSDAHLPIGRTNSPGYPDPPEVKMQGEAARHKESCTGHWGT